MNPVEQCVITIPGVGEELSGPTMPGSATRRKIGTIVLNNLPDVTDGKQAVYNNEAIMGRSFPLYTYSHSGDRTIGMQLHFFIVNRGDGRKNINYLNMIRSAVYPRQGEGGAPYMPPPICTIKCGQLLASQPICVVLQSYNVKFPTEVAWDMETYCPFRFDVDTTWLTVYTSSDLPYQDRIFNTGR